MARSGHCRTCGATIRPRAKDMSVGAASRIHYWKHHPEVMLAGQAKRQWKKREAKRTRTKARR
jgi:hypothetical protein